MSRKKKKKEIKKKKNTEQKFAICDETYAINLWFEFSHDSCNKYMQLEMEEKKLCKLFTSITLENDRDKFICVVDHAYKYIRNLIYVIFTYVNLKLLHVIILSGGKA